MVLYPQMFEQVVNFGAGIQLQDATVEALRVLDDLEYKRNTQKLGKEIRQLSPGDAADFVQHYVREQKKHIAVSDLG
jgi:hypothetical protein